MTNVNIDLDDDEDLDDAYDFFKALIGDDKWDEIEEYFAEFRAGEGEFSKTYFRKCRMIPLNPGNVLK